MVSAGDADGTALPLVTPVSADSRPLLGWLPADKRACARTAATTISPRMAPLTIHLPRRLPGCRIAESVVARPARRDDARLAECSVASLACGRSMPDGGVAPLLAAGCPAVPGLPVASSRPLAGH